MDPIRNYFKIPPSNPSDGICLKCGHKVSRGVAGKKAKSYGTTCLGDHLRRHHSVLHGEYLKQKAKYDNAKKNANNNNNIYVLNNGSGNPKAISSSQPTLALAFDSCIKYKPNDTKQTEFVYDLMEWLADAKLPFFLVMNKKFRDLWRKHAPKYTVPSDKHLREAILPDIHRRVEHAITQQLSKVEWFCGGTDLWTSQNGKAYMSLTIHFIDEAWERKMLVLNCMPYDENHSAPSLATALKSVLNTWGIMPKLHSFARDSAPNVVSAMKLNKWDHFGCFLHILALIVRHAIGKNGQPAVHRMIKRVKNMVSSYRYTNAKNTLILWQNHYKMENHVLIAPSNTRWNARYDMLERVHQQQLPIRKANTELELPATHTPTTADWEIIIPEILALLSPFKLATDKAQEESVCISEVIPHVRRLNKVINDVDVTRCLDLKTRLVNGLLNYFGGKDARQCFPHVEKTKKFTMATLLDPRFKTKLFSSDAVRDSVTAVLTAYAAKQIDEDRERRQSAEAFTPPCQQKNASFWSFDDDAPRPEAPVTHKSSTTRAREMVQQYIAEPSIPFDGDYLQFGRQMNPVGHRWQKSPIFGSVLQLGPLQVSEASKLPSVFPTTNVVEHCLPTFRSYYLCTTTFVPWATTPCHFPNRPLPWLMPLLRRRMNLWIGHLI